MRVRLDPFRTYPMSGGRWVYRRAELGRWVVATEISLDEAAEEVVLDEVVTLMRRAEGDGLELALLAAAGDGGGRRSAAAFAPREDGRTRAARARRVALLR